MYTRMHAHTKGKKEIYFKELAYTVVGSGKSAVCKAGWKFWQESVWSSESNAVWRQNSFLFLGPQAFLLRDPPTL